VAMTRQGSVPALERGQAQELARYNYLISELLT
jgi:hypothetical protein